MPMWETSAGRPAGGDDRALTTPAKADAPAVIVLNGGSSSGKSSLAVALQEALPEPWLRLGVDTLIGALPPAMTDGGLGIGFGDNGEVGLGAEFTRRALPASVGRLATESAGRYGQAAHTNQAHLSCSCLALSSV